MKALGLSTGRDGQLRNRHCDDSRLGCGQSQDSSAETAPECEAAQARVPDRSRMERMLTAAKANRWGHRDATMLLMASDMA
jgi:hypothetical protein